MLRYICGLRFPLSVTDVHRYSRRCRLMFVTVLFIQCHNEAVSADANKEEEEEKQQPFGTSQNNQNRL